MSVVCQLCVSCLSVGQLVSGQRAAASGPTQVRAWMQRDLDLRGSYAAFAVRFLGRPAASGMRQVLFTFFNDTDAALGFRLAFQWWSICPIAMDRRGWRSMPVRWFAPVLR